jgi:Ca-activated chloride channel family protein
MGAQAASRTPVFQSDIEMVNIPVTITDGANRFVTELSESDFQVLEDGVPQSLTLFTRERLPISLSVLLDTSHSMQSKLLEAQEAAVRFTRSLQQGDQAQVIQFNERARTIQDFTGDLAALERAIRGTRAGGSTALYNAVYIALKDLSAQRRADELRHMAIVVLSDGQDTASLVTDDQVLALARKTGIAVYGISLSSPVSSIATLASDTGLPRFFFSTLARDTGGDAHFVQAASQVRAIYDRVAQELRSQYSLGYISSNARRDGRWRRIDVRVPAHPQLQVRHRTGYYAPRG